LGPWFPSEVLLNVVGAKFGPDFGCCFVIVYVMMAIGNPMAYLTSWLGHDLF